MSQAPGASQEANRPKKRRKDGPRAPQSGGSDDAQDSASDPKIALSADPAPVAATSAPTGDRRGKQGSSALESNQERQSLPTSSPTAPKVPVPNARVRNASEDDELASVLAGADLDALMAGDKVGRVGVGLESGARYQARVIKIHNANVFVSLGGPNEGVIPLLQFTDMPTEGMLVDVVIRAFNADEGLYELSIPGEAISANDWSDLEEGAVVEARVESANTGGVECKVGNVRGFIPISQLSEFRIESAADFVGQRLLCVITEANPRRGNLVLSHRAVLEREKEQKRQERLASLEIGQHCEGIVRKVMDFGAFVDIGGLDGLIHISQLSWDKIKHPSEVVKEGDKVQVRIEKFDPKTGKISLSYRTLQDDPWNDVEARFPTGATVRGTVSRLANFGAFVKLATGIEGLIHISELAHRRINNVSQVLQEGQEVEVKILTVDRNAQRIGLSLKATQSAPESSRPESAAAPQEEARRESSVRKYQGPLRGGTGSSGAGELFGLKL
ncbi:MAG: S1 RNA-binding domain-containing protein [Pirellula sp.]|jgi:small subunit ribosomal protein S1|nr:S1 RNA-binding domain-containing protein [Pirellula sp.]